MKRARVAVFTAALAWGSAALADDDVSGLASLKPKISGSVAGIGFFGSDPVNGRKSAAGANLRMNADFKGNNWSALVKWDGVSGHALSAAPSRSRWRELWLRGESEKLDVTVGRQIFATGRTDVFVLQDALMPRDLSRISMSDSEQQLSLPALRFDFYPDDEWTITAAAVQQDIGSILPSSSAGQAAALVNARLPQSGYGGLLRGQWRSGATEVAMSVVNGRSPWPALHAGVTENTPPRLTQLALDGSWGARAGVLRWEAMYTHVAAGARAGIPSRRWAFSVGWDHALDGDATWTSQLIWRHDKGDRSAATPDEMPYETFNRASNQAFGEHQVWATTSYQKRIGAEHEIESILLAGTQEQVGFVQRWTWGFRDGWKLGVRLQALHGDDRSLFHHLRPRRMALAELRSFF